MKAIYEQISNQPDYSFLFRKFSLPKFDALYHYHPEIELTYIEKGFGRRFVGRNISQFESGDLVLLGANLPHCWQCDEQTEIQQDSSQATVIQFRKEFMGENLWQLPESLDIVSLIERANAGIVIKGKTKEWAIEKINGLENQLPFFRILTLLEVLQTIAVSDEIGLLDVQFSQHHFSSIETERFKKIYAYLIENYTQEISLESIAGVANLTPTAFCRYFKKITRKTFVEVLINFRINHTCHLLSTTDKPVAEVCFESGFGNISYFNKEFKKAKGLNPLAYRKSFIR